MNWLAKIRFPLQVASNVGRLIVLCLTFCLLLADTGQAADTVITDIRTGSHVGLTRVVINTDGKPEYRHFLLPDPKRFVIDVSAADWRMPDKNFDQIGVVKTIRYGRFQGGRGRIVVELGRDALPERVFLLAPTAGHGYRLVIDLKPVTGEVFSQGVSDSRAETTSHDPQARGGRADGEQASGTGLAPGFPSIPPPRHGDAFVVVIDPGHGGVDPGAIGIGGAREKHIVLAVARRIRDLFGKDPRYRIVLTRSRDTFIPLRGRINIARKAGADIFLSLHADSVSRPTTRGAGVYTLSEKASDREAASLARKENRVDLIAGVNLSAESDEVTSILIDLAQRETMNLSAELAEVLVRHMKQSTRVRTNPHRFAGFVVLKAPDVPSVLVELGFLSNRTDENLLKTKRGQAVLADAIARAIRSYGSGARSRR